MLRPTWQSLILECNFVFEIWLKVARGLTIVTEFVHFIFIWNILILWDFKKSIYRKYAQKQRDFVVPDHLKQSFGENVSTYNEFGKFSLRNRILKSWANCNFYLQRIAQIIKNPIYHTFYFGCRDIHLYKQLFYISLE
jgi:hypothetical protein